MLKEYLSTLANAFRSKLGITDKINAQNFSDKVNEVYDKGKYDEWSEYWDTLQINGTRTDYSWGFYNKGWNDTNFKPKYDFNLGYNNTIRMFELSNIKDLRGILEKRGLKFKLSNSVGNMTNMFTNSAVTRIPEMNLIGINGYYALFYGCKNLTSIKKIIIKDAAPNYFYSEWFNNCTSLKEFELEGTIFSSISFKYSPLNLETAINIINCLENYQGTGKEFTQTLSLSGTTLDLLDKADSNAPTGTDWLSYVDYLGWNLG